MKNWKTTLFGAIAALCLALAGVFPDLKEVLNTGAALFLAIATYFAKDKDSETPAK